MAAQICSQEGIGKLYANITCGLQLLFVHFTSRQPLVYGIERTCEGSAEQQIAQHFWGRVGPLSGWSQAPCPRATAQNGGPSPESADTRAAPTDYCVVTRWLNYGAGMKPYTVPLESASGTGNG